MDEYLAMVKIFASNFAPRGYALCQGQPVAIATNTPLYSLLGTIYGGDGQTTFNLPDLQGRAPAGVGQGTGLSDIIEGEKGGSQSINVTSMQLPSHTHTMNVTVTPLVNADGGNTDSPELAFLSTAAPNIYSTTAAPGQVAAQFHAQTYIGYSGASQPMNIMNPFLGVNYIICVEGVFPPRN